MSIRQRRRPEHCGGDVVQRRLVRQNASDGRRSKVIGGASQCLSDFGERGRANLLAVVEAESKVPTIPLA